MEFEKKRERKGNGEARRDKSRKLYFSSFFFTTIIEERGLRFQESFPRGVPHKFPIQVYPIQLPSGGNVSVTTSSMGRKICPRRMVRSNCRFARSTTYTRPTDVFLVLHGTNGGIHGFLAVGTLLSKFFPKDFQGFRFPLRFLKLSVLLFRIRLTGLWLDNVRMNIQYDDGVAANNYFFEWKYIFFKLFIY